MAGSYWIDFSLIKQIVSIKETEKPPNETKIV